METSKRKWLRKLIEIRRINYYFDLVGYKWKELNKTKGFKGYKPQRELRKEYREALEEL